jgi:hypothetical protein
VYAIERHLYRRKWEEITSVQTLNELTILEVQSAGCEVVSSKVLSQLLLDISDNKQTAFIIIIIIIIYLVHSCKDTIGHVKDH